MAEGFGENVAPTAAIRAILGSYPFSIGLLREILQNSDDAGAMKQIFVLDHRFHGTESIYHPYLASTQGPALLAYNDAIVQEDDWKALQNIHRSSKTADTSKIGKYGIGFRSCYHITDVPHILSGSHLAVLDPQHDFAQVAGVFIGGVKLNIVEDWKIYKDHIASFEVPDAPLEAGQPFKGTIFRLPLRKSQSHIGNRPISPGEISGLFRDFALEELDLSLLFLRNVTSIDIFEISAKGEKIKIASSSIDRGSRDIHRKYETRKSIVSKHISGSLPEEREWRIVHAPFSETEAVEALSQRLGGNPTTTLSQHKLIPLIDLAIPLDLSQSNIGRLFTFLPLPLKTEFPIHINALFSLTQSRQNLRNAGEVGIVKNSDDHALIEWNKLLFDTYIPQAWATLLEVLVEYDQITNIFDAWPFSQVDVLSGDYYYWSNVLQDVAQDAVSLPVWPVLGRSPVTYNDARSLLIASTTIKDDVLNTLTKLGLTITKPPAYITELVLDRFPDILKALSPRILHPELMKMPDRMQQLSETDVGIILEYLLSTDDCNYIANLPLIPSVRGGRISLVAKATVPQYMTHTLLTEIEEELFGVYDVDAVSLRRLASDTRHILHTNGLNILNLVVVDPLKVITYLDQSQYASPSQETLENAHVEWLNQFWAWAQKISIELALFDSFYLVATADGLRRPTETVFDLQADPHLADIFELLGVPVLDRRVDAGAHKALKQVFPSSDVHALLRTLPNVTSVSLTDEQAQLLSEYLVKYLPLSTLKNGSISSNPTLRSRLRSIPIFPMLSQSPSGNLVVSRTSISSLDVVHGIDPNIIPVLPQVPSAVWLDLQVMSQDILQYLDPKNSRPLSASEVYKLMLKHFLSQPPEVKLAFIQHLDSNHLSIPRGIFDQLAAIEFVQSCDGSFRAPKDLVDPETPVAQLFPGASSYLPDASNAALILHLRSLNLFITSPSLDMLRSRIQYISGGHAPDPAELAKILIKFVGDQNFDCRQLFHSAIDVSLKWIPTSAGFESPLTCRDALSHQGKLNLFDEAIPVIELDVGENLRRTFLWDDEVPFPVLVQQLANVLNRPEPPYDKVRAIVKELSQRKLAQEELTSLQVLLKNKRWVPTRRYALVAAPFALLGEDDFPAVGFHLARASDTRTLGFLKKMGCVSRPSKEAILSHLQSLYSANLGKSIDRPVIFELARLLHHLPQLTQDERRKLIIPDTRGVLRTFDTICYNDVGPRASLIDIGNNALVHPDIAEGLVEQLEIRRLGLIIGSANSGGADWEDDLDMGESLITTIRNRLREYTGSQLLLEFLANASDSGATEFDVLVDEKVSPASALISPRCRYFQRASSLIVHNNSVFSEEDFKGILRTGIGGKTTRKDTIGQFGLGALTMFHVTEFAMIVSQDHVLFLNPCKAHLAVDRVALRRPLSVMRRFYNDHLAPLAGLFDFNPPLDPEEEYTYNGTLFWLPLRAPDQFIPNIEPIFKKTTSLRDVISNFETVASDCLLFTSIKSIRCLERRANRPQLCWSLTAARSDPIDDIGPANFHSHLVTITSSKLPGPCRWRILTLKVDKTECPQLAPELEERYRLRNPLIVRLATAHSEPNSTHNLFSTLPLPISLDLPVHISGPFILASDRRSIRLDEYENTEATYNRWLLKSVVPMLWLYMLADRDLFPDNALYWPGNRKLMMTDDYNVVSTIVMDAVYFEAAKSKLPILRSKYYSTSLPTSSARLIYRLPRCITKVLDTIKPCDVVKLPSSVSRRLQLSADEGALSFVTPRYLHDQIQANSTSFTVTEGDAQELIEFFLDDPDTLDGLPLLPLEDGSFATFSTSLESCFFVVPSTVYDRALFKPHRVIRRSLGTDTLLNVADKLLKIAKLNVKRIENSNIHILMDDHFRRTPVIEDVETSLGDWIKNFWKIFPVLGVNLSSISSYPLISSLTPGRYLSLDYCKASTTIAADFTQCMPLSECLREMGFTLIDTTRLSKDIRSTLTALPLNVKSVTSKLREHCGSTGTSLSSLFNSLSSKSRGYLIPWFRSYLHLQGKRKKGFFNNNSQYRLLPLWTSPSGSLLSASQVQMLPSNVNPADIASFTSADIVRYDDLLLNMGITSVSVLTSILTIPKYLGEDLDAAYQKLLSVLLAHSSPKNNISVPNSLRLMKNANDLYSSRDSLFLAAFGSDSERFLLPSFRRFERSLERFGLKQQRDVNIGLFRDCIDIFVTVAGGDGFRNRAEVLFNFYAEDLPLLVSSANEYEWRTLDDKRFIPRNMAPRPLVNIDAATYMSPHVQTLPDVVSPNELVRGQMTAIAWSQRGLYERQPHERLFLTHTSLSIPTPREVVDHLLVLATQVASDHPRNASLIQHLEETYKWLNVHSEEAKPFLQQKSETSLFLNVDDPTNAAEEWKWRRADRILLDTYDTGFLQCPREFLKPFRPLLIAAGAINIDYEGTAEMPYKKKVNEEDFLSDLRLNFDSMRANAICTDVSFVCNSLEDKPLHAHRAYLAASSDYFREMFSGGFKEADVASAENPIVVPIQGYTRSCVGNVLDFVYTAKEPSFNKTESDIDLALEMLTLANAWSMMELHRVLQNIIIKSRMVDPFNLDHVGTTAENAQATKLVTYCERFEEKNIDLVRQARAASAQPE